MITRENAANDFVTIAKSLADYGNTEALRYAAQTDRNLYRLSPVIEKSASTDATSDLGTLFEPAELFLRSLNNSAVDAMRARPAPFRTPLIVMAGAVIGVVEQFQKYPIITSAEMLTVEPLKTGGICLINKDHLRVAHFGESWLGKSLRADVPKCSNRALVETLVADSGTATTTSSGSTASQILADIEAAADGFELDANSILYLLVDPQTAKNLSTKNTSGVLAFPGLGVRGGEIQPELQVIACAGWPTVDSNAPPFALLIDAAGLLVNRGDLYLKPSDDALLQMVDENGAGTERVSLFQNDLTAIRFTRTFGVRPMRPCVTKISGIEW